MSSSPFGITPVAERAVAVARSAPEPGAVAGKDAAAFASASSGKAPETGPEKSGGADAPQSTAELLAQASRRLRQNTADTLRQQAKDIENQYKS